jgi:hypothetical protein
MVHKELGSLGFKERCQVAVSVSHVKNENVLTFHSIDHQIIPNGKSFLSLGAVLYREAGREMDESTTGRNVP